MLILYTVTLFLSAFLLFLVQPLFGRLVLPLLGGSPAVWNTVMVFFQAALLAGYGYAHVSLTRLGIRRQSILHLVVLPLPLLVLPLRLPAGWSPPAEQNPIPWLLGLMVVSVGLPFLVVSTTSSVLQRWFAATGHPSGKDPYFLYAASNLGSMLALLGYPTLVEPNLSLADQTRLWAGGYVLLLVLIVACRVVSRFSPETTDEEPDAGAPLEFGDDRVTPRRRLSWVLLSFVPSSLMLGVTTYLSTDIAAVPLLWVIPLALYLLTYILVFARREIIPQALLERALPILMVPMVIVLGMRASQPLSVLMGLHLLTFFVATLLCHGKLAKDRPPARHLTEFYLWMSVGGVLGGAFNALVAPVAFPTVLEYPITLVAASFLGIRRPEDEARQPVQDWLLPAGLTVLSLGLVFGAQAAHLPGSSLTYGLLFGLPALLCYLLSQRPVSFGLAVAAVLLAGVCWRGEQGRVLHAERSFFGVHRVTIDPEARYRQLFHGSTLHGRESLDPARRREPLTYFTRTGPVGQVFETYGARFPGKVAVVGLGVGSLAAYARPEQHWVLYEIDPAVLHIAAEPRYFSYLQDCRAKWEVVLGDARLAMTRRSEKYGILVLDAYSSDSLPIHLITREALRLYLDRLEEPGILVFQASNRQLELEPVLAALAQDAGLTALYRGDTALSDEEKAQGKTQSQWVVMARRPETLKELAADARWQPARARPGLRVWTDDYSSILSVFNWQ